MTKYLSKGNDVEYKVSINNGLGEGVYFGLVWSWTH